MKNIERVIGKIEVSDNRAIIFTATDVVDYTFTNPVDGSITEYTGVVSGIYQLTGDELKLVLITRPSEYIPLLEDFNVDSYMEDTMYSPAPTPTRIPGLGDMGMGQNFRFMS